MLNEKHGKSNKNKDEFKVYLGRHLKEVVIPTQTSFKLLELRIRQISRTK
jgi:hypothetical protein